MSRQKTTPDAFRGTDGSNLVPSSAESNANFTFIDCEHQRAFENNWNAALSVGAFFFSEPRSGSAVGGAPQSCGLADQKTIFQEEIAMSARTLQPTRRHAIFGGITAIGAGAAILGKAPLASADSRLPVSSIEAVFVPQENRRRVVSSTSILPARILHR